MVYQRGRQANCDSRSSVSGSEKMINLWLSFKALHHYWGQGYRAMVNKGSRMRHICICQTGCSCFIVRYCPFEGLSLCLYFSMRKITVWSDFPNRAWLCLVSVFERSVTMVQSPITPSGTADVLQSLVLKSFFKMAAASRCCLVLCDGVM